jgi:hypothetical protein
LAPIRRTARNLVRRGNPIRDLFAEKQRTAEIIRSRQQVESLQSSLPALIENQIGEHMQRLEDKLVTDFRNTGQRAIEESTAALNDQLQERIQSLENFSALQSKTLSNLSDTTRVTEQKVDLAVNSIEKSIAEAVPGFRLEPARYPDAPGSGYSHPQFQLNPRTEVVKATPQDLEETAGGKTGFCPSCTSTNIRRATRQGLFEEFLRLFFIAPFRCRSCRHKFYRF